MKEFWILILVSLFATNSMDKAESVQLEETPLKIIDEIFGEGWWDNDKEEEWNKLTLEQNVHHQIDRQNTQIGQIEPNSTDQNPPLTKSDQLGQIEPNSTDQNPPLTVSDHSGQIEPNSTDQNPPLTVSDHSGQIVEPNSIDQNPPLTVSDHSGQIEPNSTDHNPPFTASDHSDNPEDERKRKIIDKFHAIRGKFKEKGKYSAKERTQIEEKIAKHLNVNRTKIYEWKKEFGLSRKMHNFGKKKNDRKNLLETFDQMKAELKRNGLKNSYSNQINKTVAKELGITDRTIYRWKRKLGQIKPNKHSHSEQKELMDHYYEIKNKNPKISDKDIAKSLKIGKSSLYNWKRQFKRQQFYQNSVDGHCVGENAAEKVQEKN